MSTQDNSVHVPGYLKKNKYIPRKPVPRWLWGRRTSEMSNCHLLPLLFEINIERSPWILFFFSFPLLEFLFLFPKGQFTAEEPNFLWVIEAFSGHRRELLHVNKMLWLLTCPLRCQQGKKTQPKVKQASKGSALSIWFLSHTTSIGYCPEPGKRLQWVCLPSTNSAARWRTEVKSNFLGDCIIWKF